MLEDKTPLFEQEHEAQAEKGESDDDNDDDKDNIKEEDEGAKVVSGRRASSGRGGHKTHKSIRSSGNNGMIQCDA